MPKETKKDNCFRLIFWDFLGHPLCLVQSLKIEAEMTNSLGLSAFEVSFHEYLTCLICDQIRSLGHQNKARQLNILNIIERSKVLRILKKFISYSCTFTFNFHENYMANRYRN
ncbi:hypothetical protein BpHYR1_040597 [Brachionus plicatilis]|uniref:Uncharacterized protein n=1 Tax=Brachionus plicatilis TaxID=10195 RepID=A0A3M7RHQ3_BRAPC|nr:hypothetical protein BpHYR1_040597 [Brachionus plicatilis]